VGTIGTQPDPWADDELERVALDRRGARFSQHRLLNRLSALVAAVAVLATLTLWLPLGRHVLTQLFPLPPYRDTYAYLATGSGFLLALRSSDGVVHWRSASNNYDSEVEV
jgi:hypothetical protein